MGMGGVGVSDIITIFFLALPYYFQHLANFYLLLDLNMTKRQVGLHLILSLFWNLILQGVTYIFGLNQVGWFSVFWELLYVFAWMYLCAEDSLWINMFSMMLGSWAGNAMCSTYYTLICPSAMAYMLGDSYQNVEWKHVLVTGFLVVATTCVVRKPVRCITRVVGSQRKITVPAICLFIIFIVFETVFRQSSALEITWFYEGLRVILLLIFLAVVALIFLWIKNLDIKRRKMALQKSLDVLNTKYQKMWQEQEDLHKIQHEINNQKNAVLKVQEFITEEELYGYYKNVSEQFASYTYISQCGDVYIDSVVQKYYEELSESNIVVETVLEPLQYPDMAQNLLCVIDEMFRFCVGELTDKKWCRVILRQKQGQILVKLEVGFDSDRPYRHWKWLDIVGNGMLIRGHFRQTRTLAWRYGGTWMYGFQPQLMEMAVMLNAGEEQMI